MQTNYGFKLSESCPKCKFRRNGFFCQISPVELNDFNEIKSISAYQAGALLFLERQRPKGFFQVCEGEVKLYLTSSEGKTITLRIAKPGDVIGMWAALSDAPYEGTAKSLRPCQVAFVSSSDFRQYLRKHPAVLRRALSYVGMHYQTVCEQLAAIGLGASVMQKLARFLLDWSAESGALRRDGRFALSLSHEEIAENLGTSRESVTRMLKELRNLGLIEKHGKCFAIPDRAALLCVKAKPWAAGPRAAVDCSVPIISALPS